MSGYTDNALSQAGMADQGIAYLQKPFTPDQLATKVREIIGAKSRPAEPSKGRWP
jgi:CheY-like chemotaxis protein